MASKIPNASSRNILLQEALEGRSASLQEQIEDLQQKLGDAEAHAKRLSSEASTKRWLLRAAQDATVKVQELHQQLSQAQADKKTLHARLVAVESKFHKAIDDLGKQQRGSRMVSTSLHSATKTFRRSNVVLMAPENAEECLRQYMKAEMGLQEAPLLLTAGDICDECGVQMVIVSNDSMLSCTSCHKLRLLPNTMTTSALHGTDVEVSNTITKHRLPEWIEMAQGKEFADAPADLLRDVASFLVRNNMTGLEAHAAAIAEERAKGGPFRSAEDAAKRLHHVIPDLPQRLKQINSATARIALRGLVTDGMEKYRKFYERSAKVAALVSGYWPPRMTTYQEETLRLLYTVAAPKYERRRKPKQTYWPGGFPFFLRCLCVLLGWDEFASAFPVPSGSKEGGCRDLLRNEIWEELGWEVVPYTGKLPPLTLPDGTQLHTVLDDDEGGGGLDEDTKHIKKEVDSKIAIKKRRRVDVELSCA